METVRERETELVTLIVCHDYLFQDLVVTLLLTNMRASVSAKGFVIQGFPRDMEQASQYDKLVSAWI